MLIGGGVFLNHRGKVFVFTGLLPLCKTEAGLAAILGHEIAHNVVNHAAEQLSQRFILTPLVIFASLLLDVSTGLINGILDIGYSKPGSRRQEVRFYSDFLGWADVKGLFLSEEARKDGLIPWVLVGGGSYRTLYVLNLQVLGISKQLTRTVIMAKACYDPEAAVLV